MSETTEHRHIRPEAVGQDRPPELENRSGVGGYMMTQMAMWIVVIVIGAIFLAAMIIFAVTR